VITLDTSAVFALLDARDQRHTATRSALEAESPPLLIPAATLGEIGHLIATRFGERFLDPFLADIDEGRYVLDCGDEDAPRAQGLVARYRDLPLGLVDAYVAACAERNDRRVLTLDRRHFDVVGRELGLEVRP